MDGSSLSHHLDYAAQSPRKTRLWRRLRWAILILLVGFFLVAIGPNAWRSLKLVYWQNRCLAYTAPIHEIVYSPAQDIFVVASPWAEFQAARRESLASPATVFVHERTAPGGSRRLVILDAGFPPAKGFSQDTPIVLIERVFRPGTATSSPLEATTIANIHPFSFQGKAVVYAGQPDQRDASHFTIRVTHSNGETILDGWLRDDDTVLIEPRPTQPVPATMPVQP